MGSFLQILFADAQKYWKKKENKIVKGQRETSMESVENRDSRKCTVV
jgi:hypothetical protein